MQPLSGNQRPDLLTSLMNMSLALRLPHHMHLCRSSSNVPLTSFLEMLQNNPVLLTFGKVQNPLRLQRKATSEPSKVVRACGVFNVLIWKRASHHNSMHFFNISTSKSAPKPSDILTSKRASRHKMACTFSISQLPNRHAFDFEMCFTPQNGVHFFDIVAPKPSRI